MGNADHASAANANTAAGCNQVNTGLLGGFEQICARINFYSSADWLKINNKFSF